MTEQEIIDALARKDKAAVGSLFELYKKELIKYLISKGAILEDAEDVLMDVICSLVIRAFEKGIHIQPGKLAGFLKRSVAFRYYSFLRHKNPAAPTVTFPELERLPSEEEKDFRLEMERYVLLRESLEKLNSGCRDLIKMYYHEGELLKAIGPKKEWTYDYTRQKHHRCLKQLQRFFTSDPRYKDLYD